MLCCLLKHESGLEQALQLLTACVIVFHRFRLCPSHSMKKPIKALWLGRADNIACTDAAAGGTVSTQEVQRSVKMTMTSFI